MDETLSPTAERKDRRPASTRLTLAIVCGLPAAVLAVGLVLSFAIRAVMPTVVPAPVPMSQIVHDLGNAGP